MQEGGLYGPGVYARVVVGKTDDSLPLHRMAKIFARDGVAIAPSTLGSLFHRAAELLTPIYNELCSIAQRDPYINADETRMPVQAKGKCRKAWVCNRSAGDPCCCSTGGWAVPFHLTVWTTNRHHQCIAARYSYRSYEISLQYVAGVGRLR